MAGEEVEGDAPGAVARPAAVHDRLDRQLDHARQRRQAERVTRAQPGGAGERGVDDRLAPGEGVEVDRAADRVVLNDGSSGERLTKTSSSERPPVSTPAPPRTTGAAPVDPAEHVQQLGRHAGVEVGVGPLPHHHHLHPVELVDDMRVMPVRAPLT